MLVAQTLEVRAMPLIVLPVSALLLLWAWAGAFLLLSPDRVDPAIRWGALPMLIIFGGLFVWSLVGLFNYRIRMAPHEITILLPSHIRSPSSPASLHRVKGTSGVRSEGFPRIVSLGVMLPSTKAEKTRTTIAIAIKSRFLFNTHRHLDQDGALSLVVSESRDLLARKKRRPEHRT